MTRRPLIGITTRHAGEAWIERHTQRYLDAIRAAGGEPVVLAPASHAPGEAAPQDQEGFADDAMLDGLDGLLLSGGGDIDPREYGEDPAGSEEIDPARDALELTLARAALNRNLPVLGICRGFQVLNVACGGRLVQDLPGHRGALTAPDRRADTPHAVDLAPGSRVAALLGDMRPTVNSFHHQAVTPACLGTGLVITARHGEIAEAIEAPAYRWVLGVQWHPERYRVDAAVFSAPDAQRVLFEDFVAAARAGVAQPTSEGGGSC